MREQRSGAAQLAAAHERSDPRAGVERIAGEHLVGALAIEHHLDAGAARGREHPMLGVDAGADKGQILIGDQPVEIAHQLAGLKPHLVHGRAGCRADHIGEAFLVEGGAMPPHR